MKALPKSLDYCVKEKKPCVRWVERYFKDCLCNLKDEFSFGLGLVSVVCWGAAEVPQIITNFRTKSSHGVSLAFLLAWLAGDVLNLVGCHLEPATLPTQFYTALLYTISTVILVWQSVYYNHIRRWWTHRQIGTDQVVEEEIKKPLKHSGIPIPSAVIKASPHGDFYYTSARSFRGSNTPPFRSYLKAARSGPSAWGFYENSSSDDETTPVSSMKKSVSLPRQIPLPRSVGYGAFLATSVNLPPQSNALMDVYVRFTGRRLLHENGIENAVYGRWFGWLMTAIYVGSPIPQICLNIQRGSMEGLNPLMFILAVMANVTYVGSILVRTVEWEKIKGNMPWLVDAGACMVLDLFILLQYSYYGCIQRRIAAGGADHGDSVETSKAALP